MLFVFSCSANQDIVLPKFEASSGIDLIKAIETRTASRSYLKSSVPLKVISSLLWSGIGITLKSGLTTVNGHDAKTGATNKNRQTIPLGWGQKYLKIYLLLEKGAYEYQPNEHILKLITQKDLIQLSGSGGQNAYGVFVIAVDYTNLPGQRNRSTENVAFVSAGSAAQNMYLAGTAYNLQMLTQIHANHDSLKKELNFNSNTESLVILPFGYSK